MPLNVRAGAEGAERYMAGVDRWARQAISQGQTSKEVKQALTQWGGRVRTVYRLRGNITGVSMSRAARLQLGVENGGLVEEVLNQDGSVSYLPVDRSKLGEWDRKGVDHLEALTGTAPSNPRMAPYGFICQQCRRPSWEATPGRSFCRKCAYRRAARCKALWRRRRKRATAAEAVEKLTAVRHVANADKTRRHYSRNTSRTPTPILQLRRRADQRSARKDR